jgi:hypothetical protein
MDEHIAWAAAMITLVLVGLIIDFQGRHEERRWRETDPNRTPAE